MDKKTIYLTVKDHSVSGEDFQLLYHQELDLLETFPQPNLEKLPAYYKSDDYISHTDAKRNLFEKAYHVVKSRSLNRKLKLINSFNTKTKNLLDVGCGTGDFLSVAQNNGWDINGVEPNENARDLANKKTNQKVYDTDHFFKFDKSSFDVITLWHVLEHLPNLDEHISIFSSLLKPNGKLIVAVPNYRSFDAKHYKNFWAAYDVPRHLWHFSKISISKLMIIHQMKVVKILPMRFDAFYVSLLSEKYRTGSMNPIRAFFIGLLSNLKAIKTKEHSSLIYVLEKAKNQF